MQLGLPAFRRFPAVLTIHDLAPLRWPSHYLRLPHSRVVHAWQYALAKHADAIVAVSEATKADVVARLGIHPERIRVIPEAVDSSFQPPSKADGASIAHARFGIPDRYVLYVDNSIRAEHGWPVRRVRSRGRDFGSSGRSGSSGLMRDAGAFARRSGARRDRHRGDRAAALYAGARVPLHAAWLGLGLTTLESLAAGTRWSLPGAVAEVVADAGLLVDDQDGDRPRRALAALLDDPSLQAQLRARAKPRAARFSWDRAADDTLAIYRSLT